MPNTDSLSHLKLADDYDLDRDLNIDILIGVDNYWKFVYTNTLQFDDLVAHETFFGWVLLGSCLRSSDTCYDCNFLQMPCIKLNSCDFNLHHFWNLESIGIFPEDTDNVPNTEI